MAAGVQRLQSALEGVVLSVQRVIVTIYTRLNHFHCNLDITQCLKKKQKKKTQQTKNTDVVQYLLHDKVKTNMKLL